MSKYMPTILLILTGLGSAFAPQIQHLISAHSAVFGAVASVLGVILHWLPSPSAPPVQ